MRKLTLVLLLAAAATAGCSSKPKPNPYAYLEHAVQVPVRLHHDFYSSWGHDGRGGAALRKPAYQHVMGDEDMVMTTHGNYKDLRDAKFKQGTSAVNTAMNQGMGQAISTALDSVPSDSGVIVSAMENRPPLTTTGEEYERAYRKFCTGATMTLTDREWEIVALGGPKGIPSKLRGMCRHSK